MGAYVFLDALLRRDSWRRWVVWAIFVAAVVSILFTGTYVRIVAEEANVSLMHRLDINISSIPIKAVFCVGSFFLSVAASIVNWRRGRMAEVRELTVVCGTMAGQFLMCIFMARYGRTMWGAYMFAVIAILLSLQILIFEKMSRGWIWRALLIVFAGLYGYWLVELVVWQRQTLAMNDALVAQVSPRHSSRFDVLYGPDVHWDSAPAYLQEMTSPLFETSGNCVDSFVWFWISPEKGAMAVLPDRYRGLPLDSIPEFGGNAGARGAWPYVLFDEPFEGMLEISGGSLGPNASALVRLVSLARGQSDENKMYVWVRTEAVMAPDSTAWPLAQIFYVPRTFRYRPILRVDTLERR